MTTLNYGLSGQVDEFDEFLCLSKACREAKKKKRELRNEKKQLKNDAKRAETDLLRAETELIRGAGGSVAASPPPPVVFPPVQSDSDFEPQPDSTSSGSPLLWVGLGLVGLLALGGAAIWFIRRRRKAAP